MNKTKLDKAKWEKNWRRAMIDREIYETVRKIEELKAKKARDSSNII